MAEGRMNLAALQQRDPYITEIVDTASQVALYSFNSKTNEWERTSIEGSLFIYKRSASPWNGFMILNRLGLNNLVEPITKDLEFQQQDPFLLYRNAKSIFGVWFYDRDECGRLGGMLNRYVQEILEEQRRKQGLSPVVGTATGKERESGRDASMVVHGQQKPSQSQVDIMQMLSKAQQEYDTMKTELGDWSDMPIEEKPVMTRSPTAEPQHPQDSVNNNFCFESTGTGVELTDCKYSELKMEQNSKNETDSKHAMFSDYRIPYVSMIGAEEFDNGVTVKTQPNSTSSDEVSAKESVIPSTTIVKRKNGLKKRKTMQRMRYVDSSSDEDIPLRYSAKHAWTTHMNRVEDDEDLTYDPNRETDISSADCELKDLLDEKTKNKLKKDNMMKQLWEKTTKRIKKKKGSMKKTSPRNYQKSFLNSTKEHGIENAGQEKSRANVIQQVLMESSESDNLQKQLVSTEMAKIDSLLALNHLTRQHIRPCGNCFFESSAKQLHMSSAMLRHQLCKELEDNLKEYIAFVLNRHHPDGEETVITDYLTEINKLKQDGYWTSDVADLLPLVLSNFSQRSVTLYTNKAEQPVIRIDPTHNFQMEVDLNNDIKLAYISLPGVLEHYDACSYIVSSQCAFTKENSSVESCFPDSPDTHGQNIQAKSPVKKDTSRKKAVFITQEEKLPTRKRKANPKNWKKNVRKKLRLSGEQYTSAEGKIIPPRSLQQIDCSKCRLKCETKISHEQRQHLFNSFWQLGNYTRQKDYVCSRIEEEKTKTYLDESGNVKSKRKQVTRKFNFEIEGMKRQICKTFFVKTLCIGNAYIDHAMKYKKDGCFTGQDLRGKHTPHNKLSSNQTDYAKKHIESFQRIGGHYVQKETNREFLGSELKLQRMYELYTEKCKHDDLEPVKMSKYRQIFNLYYNVSFQTPKQDQYNTCTTYCTAVENGTATQDLQEDDVHHEEKNQRAREENNIQGTSMPASVRKKTEPKPMIDNPNAAATSKTSNIIRPKPLKIPDTEDAVEDVEETGATRTPLTAGTISLDALFRTASLQQGAGATAFPAPDSKPPTILKRSVSMTSGKSVSGDYTEESTAANELPSILKHIMSSGSMVEDIERHHIVREEPIPTIPDVSQPPPNHPAYRGPSPHTQSLAHMQQPRKSPRDMQPSAKDNVVFGLHEEESYDFKLKHEPGTKTGPKLVPGSSASTSVLPSALVPSSISAITSQSSSVQITSKETVLKGKMSPRGHGDSVKKEVPEASPPVPKSEALLTPADLLQPSTALFSSQPEKQSNPNLAAAAASLTTELLSPMAFISSTTTRKTPPVTTATERQLVEEKVKESDPLPVAALTKEQLQQALLYLIKNDSSFISTIHEAYLNSLKDLAGHKS